MKFTPNYTVSYHGEFHRAGIPFDIEDKDVKEMSAHGVVLDSKAQKAKTQTESEDESAVEETVNEQPEPEQDDEQSDDNRPKRGRSKKQEESNDAD